jgi:hypothetical protein
MRRQEGILVIGQERWWSWVKYGDYGSKVVAIGSLEEERIF